MSTVSTRRSFLLFGANDAHVFTDISKDSARRGEVSYPERLSRRTEPLPASVGSRTAFLRKCVGCLKCLSVCPRGLLRVSEKYGHFARPALDFRYGWCYPECSLCASACPAGALGKPLSAAAKLKTRAGLAEWNRGACLAAKGVTCTACQRHCPAKAITRAKDGTPVVDAEKCIGCGACEYHCPAHPQSAIHVEGCV